MILIVILSLVLGVSVHPIFFIFTLAALAAMGGSNRGSNHVHIRTKK